MPLLSQSQEEVDTRQKFVMRYASTSWNADAKKIDNAFLFVRDKESGKTVKIVLDETEPDSSLFQGSFAISFDEKKITPEVYNPPISARKDSKSLDKFSIQVRNGSVTPLPTLIRTDNTSTVFEVFDTKAQAKRASDAYKMELEAKNEAEKTKLIKPKTDDGNVQMAKDLGRQMELAKLASLAATREMERIRLEQLEQQRLEQIKAASDRLNQKEQQRRRSEAVRFAEMGSNDYQKGEYPSAEENFRKATELDPNDKSYYFKYGVTLFRNQKFDEALVALKIAKSDNDTDLERRYYIGLIHFRLQEYELALKAFEKVRESQHPVMSPSSAFYIGIIQMGKDELDQAQKSFEDVIDTSSDPALDKKSEENIEKIARLKEYKKMAARKWMVNAKSGLNYDSNVLLVSDTDTSTAAESNKAGLRLNANADASYRFFFTEKSEFSTKLAGIYVYSIDDEFASADPTVLTLTAPYVIKGSGEGKTYKLTLTPGYETLFMDFDSSGVRTNILNTFMANIDYLRINKPNWFSNTNLDIRNDDSQIIASADDRADAIKVGLKRSEMLFLDESKKKMILGFLGYVLNAADGKNKTFGRVELGTIYSAPWTKFKNFTWNTGFSTYLMNFSKADETREDRNMTLLFGTNKMINENWAWSTSGSYVINSSDQSSFAYNKYSVFLNISYNWAQ